MDCKYKIFKTNNYLLIPESLQIQESNWFWDGDGEICLFTSDYAVNLNQ